MRPAGGARPRLVSSGRQLSPLSAPHGVRSPSEPATARRGCLGAEGDMRLPCHSAGRRGHPTSWRPAARTVRKKSGSGPGELLEVSRAHCFLLRSYAFLPRMTFRLPPAFGVGHGGPAGCSTATVPGPCVPWPGDPRAQGQPSGRPALPAWHTPCQQQPFGKPRPWPLPAPAAGHQP